MSRVRPGAVPGVDKIDLAGCADVRHGIWGCFDVRKLLSARRDYGLGLVGHFSWPEIGPADEADLHVMSEGLQRRLSNQTQDTPWTSFASTSKHWPLNVNSGWPDINWCEIDFRLFDLLRARGALARKHNEKRQNTADPESDLHRVLPYRLLRHAAGLKPTEALPVAHYQCG